ncbi:MAG: type II restriction endonuclease [Bellilinea sp.]
MNLDSVFISVAYKTLTLVDLPKRGSNQHEINGVVALKDFFTSSEPISGAIRWHLFADDIEPQHSEGRFTFYDARLRSAARTGRSEWRMYYSGEFIDYANPGDILILARTKNNIVYGLIFRENSGWLRAAQILFGINVIQPEIQILSDEYLTEQQLGFSKEQILQELGIEFETPANEKIDSLAVRELTRARKSNIEFPNTKTMSDLARTMDIVDIANADDTLITWLDYEEKLFRAMEKIIVQEKLNKGFDSVDDFIDYSLSTQNRRKSRMGYALQNHLSFLFTQHNLKYETEKSTEGKNKPDFLFPGKSEYMDSSFDENLLVMLGAKSSCKERWRQILTEANRIKVKHLCTLEQAISKDQTDEMVTHHVQLVLPAQFHSTYSEIQQNNIWSVNQFINFVKTKQAL